MNTDTDNGLLLVLTGLPASGKDTIVRALLADSSLKLNRITTFATREIRKGEINGKDHYFVSKEQFRLLQKKGALLEHVKSGTTWKGTPKEPFKNIIKFNHRCVWRIDPYRSIRTKTLFQKHFGKKMAEQLYSKTVTVFINVSDKETLKKRWLTRKKDEDIKQFEIRYAKDIEIFEKLKNKYDYIIDNDQNIEKTIEEIKTIITGATSQQESG